MPFCLSNKNLFSQITLILVMAATSTPIAQPRPLLAHNNSSDTQSEIPKRLARKFWRDAARLSLRTRAEAEDLRYQAIQVPRQSIQDFYDILSQIYLANETAKSIERCNVHTFPDPSIDHFIVIFNRSADWATPLHQGISETTSDEINDLLDDYDLVIEKHVQWNDDQDAITIRSRELLNMAALANEFYNIEDVTEIDLGVPKTGGNDIQVKRVQDGWEVKYILRFGSYISGKGQSHTWSYKAFDDGTIAFIAETGDEIPAWMRCQFQSNEMFTSGRL